MVGIGAAALAFKFSEAWGVCVIGIGAGIFFAAIILLALKVSIQWLSILGYVIGGAIGGYLGKTFNKEVRCIGTSIIGSYLAVFGVSIYVGNFPTQLTLQYGLA